MMRRQRLVYSPDPMKCPRGTVELDSGELLDVRLRDLSGWGVGFVAGKPIHEKENLIFAFTNGGGTTRVRALVRWSNQLAFDEWAVGCEFTLDGATDFPVDLGDHVDEGSGVTRIPVRIPVTIRDESAAGHPATIVNYSDGGICIVSETDFAAGESVLLQLPGCNQGQLFVARVQWHRSDDIDQRHGCAFTDVDDANTCFDLLQDYVAEHGTGVRTTVAETVTRLAPGVLAGTALVVGWCLLFLSGGWTSLTNQQIPLVMSYVG